MSNSEITFHKDATSLGKLEDSFDKTPSLLDERRAFIMDKAKTTSENNKNFLTRIFQSREDKELAKALGEQEQKMFKAISEQENASIKALAETNTIWIKQVCNTLLTTGRSGLESHTAVTFKKTEGNLLKELDRLSNEFYDLIEKKEEEYEKRSSKYVKKMLLKDIETCYQSYEKSNAEILTRFYESINQRV